MVETDDVQIIIPARYSSVRLPGKVLEKINGRSLIQHVVSQASKVCNNIIVASDDQRIFNHCNDNGIHCILTSQFHASGTDRVAEAAKESKAKIIINLQADEPFIEPEVIQSLISLMRNPFVKIGTLVDRITDEDTLFDFNVVKVAKTKNDKVLYFSRQVIPAQRDIPFSQWMKDSEYYRHLGIYGFKNETLQKITKLQASELERIEKLEQLRWLENEFVVYCSTVKTRSFGIDTEEDLKKAREFTLM